MTTAVATFFSIARYIEYNIRVLISIQQTYCKSFFSIPFGIVNTSFFFQHCEWKWSLHLQCYKGSRSRTTWNGSESQECWWVISLKPNWSYWNFDVFFLKLWTYSYTNMYGLVIIIFLLKKSFFIIRSILDQTTLWYVSYLTFYYILKCVKDF